jgi:hypothetical protein
MALGVLLLAVWFAGIAIMLMRQFATNALVPRDAPECETLPALPCAAPAPSRSAGSTTVHPAPLIVVEPAA